MDFRPMDQKERESLRAALRNNAGGGTILTDRKDTGFAGVADEVPEDEVINAIRSVPTHYGE